MTITEGARIRRALEARDCQRTPEHADAKAYAARIPSGDPERPVWTLPDVADIWGVDLEDVRRLVDLGLLQLRDGKGQYTIELIAPRDAVQGAVGRKLETLALAAENERLRVELADANDLVAELSGDLAALDKFRVLL